MKVLAIETATPASSVALGEDGALAALNVRVDPRGHLGHLLHHPLPGMRPQGVGQADGRVFLQIAVEPADRSMEQPVGDALGQLPEKSLPRLGPEAEGQPRAEALGRKQTKQVGPRLLAEPPHGFLQLLEEKSTGRGVSRVPQNPLRH